MTQQVPAQDSESRLDDDLDALLDDDPEAEMNEKSTWTPVTETTGTVPLEQIDAMLADRADEEAEDVFGSVDNLIGDKEEAAPPEPATAAAPSTGPVTLPDLTAGPPPAPLPMDETALEGAGADAVASELADDEASHALTDSLADEPPRRGPLAGTKTLLSRIGLRRLLAIGQRSCSTINRPVRHLPPDMRNMVGYTGLVTIFTATLLILGKMIFVLMAAP